MKLLTMNCWHGLSGPGTWRLTELEPEQDRLERYTRQNLQLAAMPWDLICLQEVNPLMVRLPQILQALSGEYRAVVQQDLTGVKVLGVGVPVNLNSGLAVIAPKKRSLSKKAGLQLSGTQGVSSTVFSLQVDEGRFALIAETELKGERVLVVNTHLHHGLPITAEALSELDSLESRCIISSEQKRGALDALQGADNRRRQELGQLREALTESVASGTHVLVMGDLNLEPHDPALTEFMESLGLMDVVEAYAPGLKTFDVRRNAEIFALSDQFELPVPDFGLPELKGLWRSQNRVPRRLDHVLMTPGLAQHVHKVELWGVHANTWENTSDHFGLMVELS